MGNGGKRWFYPCATPSTILQRMNEKGIEKGMTAGHVYARLQVRPP